MRISNIIYCYLDMPLTISELCIHLNEYAKFVSPPAGQNPAHGAAHNIF